MRRPAQNRSGRSLSPRLLALAVLALSCGAAWADEIECNVQSDYELTLNERSVIFTRDTGTPKAIVMRQGRLFVDDKWLSLSAADSRRIADFEQQTRAAMPEAQRIGREAAEIAFTALGEVAAGFSSDPKTARAKLDKARAQIDARLARSVTPTHFNGDDLGEGIGEAVGEVIPSLIGDIVGGAIGAAFSGDETRLKRLENLDAQVEAKVKPRADALEVRAESLCRRMVELDRLDNELEVRVDGKPLNLMTAKAEPRTVKVRK
ncbi:MULTISPECIES: DUF2884 family protein [unclassified Lysobacter]|uniref:DUF2884 family protein n=1 Tax=unclassified Lysobacter TaxID=2635362 RepID=UPI0006FDFB46|nr:MULTISPECIES: DUF2884 family protein [unclassified Lysobacter]KQZ59568.1 hypothetical protein ASD53_04990 [Lysobacter sp. Root559]KRA75822.1 hypothetical protein ASD78_07600 [Lysobacter sp. Root667]KRC36620.1 hypothetical protein ASE10_05765 [Lysobacter sp. Root76]KRD66714.1 hypothetical protein ASE45_15415 [Lysobacter sp. Root96]